MEIVFDNAVDNVNVNVDNDVVDNVFGSVVTAIL